MDLDEVAHDEPPHQDLRCLQIQLFSSLVVKELTDIPYVDVLIRQSSFARAQSILKRLLLGH